MLKRWGMVAAMVLPGLLIGCGPGDDDDGPQPESEETGVAIAIDYYEETDVEGFQVTILDCDEGEVVSEATRSLEEMVIPGENPEFVDAPYDADSGHHFADHFKTVDAGCYDVQVQPVDGAGEPSGQCQGAQATQVHVVDGKTTELVLTSQCDGKARGAADVIGALNHPPVVETVDYDPSKFVHECEKVDICVTAYDPDGDPMEFEFEQIGGQDLRFDLEVTEPKVDGKRATACARAVPVWNDDYEFRVTVYDLVWEDGEKVRAEDVIGEESRGTRTFPLYSNWDIELECYDRETGLFHKFKGVRHIDRHKECIPIWPEEFYCSDFHWDYTDRTCPGDEFKPETVYPLCENKDEDLYESEGRELGEDRW